MKNKKNSFISVVMLNYNGLKYLKRTIKPILDLDYPNYEFIIVDNGSTDGSIKYIKKFKKIKLINSPKNNKNFACNYAINKAKGEYILLMDNDALIVENSLLNSLFNRYNKNKKTGVIGLSFYDEESQKSASYGGYLSYHYVTVQKKIKINDLSLYDNCRIAFPEGKGLFISKELWLFVGGYDQNVIFGCDDTDLGIKCMHKGYINYLYSKKIQKHLGIEERINNDKYAWKWENIYYSHFYSIFKNYSTKNLVVAIPSYLIWGFMKLSYQGIKRKNFKVFLSYFFALKKIIKNIPFMTKVRKKVQNERIVKKDIFLKIRPKKAILK